MESSSSMISQVDTYTAKATLNVNTNIITMKIMDAENNLEPGLEIRGSNGSKATMFSHLLPGCSCGYSKHLLTINSWYC